MKTVHSRCYFILTPFLSLLAQYITNCVHSEWMAYNFSFSLRVHILPQHAGRKVKYQDGVNENTRAGCNIYNLL